MNQPLMVYFKYDLNTGVASAGDKAGLLPTTRRSGVNPPIIGNTPPDGTIIAASYRIVDGNNAQPYDYINISIDGNAPAVPALSNFNANALMLYDDNTQGYYKAFTSSALNMSYYDWFPNAIIQTPAPNWAIENTPALNTIATVTKAAPGAGYRHVITGFSAYVAATVTSPICIVHIHNGVNTVFSAPVISLGGTAFGISLSGLSIVCDDNAAATVEFHLAPGAGNQQTVSLMGFTVGP